MNKKVDIILQARLGSTRLPKKVLAKIGELSVFEFQVLRLKRSPLVNNIILATTQNKEDDILEEIAIKLNLKVVRGSENDVLSRFCKALKISDSSLFIRITGDCPFIDHHLIKEVIDEFHKQKVDYLSNCSPPFLPDGFDVEIFTRDALIVSQKNNLNNFQKEHVTPWMRDSGKFKIGHIKRKENFSEFRVTIDEQEDLILARKIVRHFNNKNNFKWHEIIDLLQKNPDLVKINSKFHRNEGERKLKGQKLWGRAKKIIPGGNMLLSKRPELFLPDKWPTYFSKCKGCKVWDLENNEYIDMNFMGVGTNSLGYGNDEVDNAVRDTISSGNMSSLNCPEEVLLAEKLVEMHSWSDQVRFARTGGEANAIAIRIARAATGKDVIAFCGYHGWHDWYLATNLKNSSGLKEHLLDGLQPKGVPSALEGTVKPFKFNEFSELEKIVENNSVGAVKMEVERTVPPEPDFLQKVRDLCTKKGIVLIFDECTSGFRETFGGIHKKYKVNPDMAIFGKALGNGYAITAVIGKTSIMQSAQNTFISSTFWTERIGPTAGLKTLEIMESSKSWEFITNQGKYLRQNWLALSKKYGLNLTLFGIPALSGFQIKSKKALEYKTLITQEMLKKGFLASNVCYLCTSHTNSIIDEYITNLEPIFEIISDCENGKDIYEFLDNNKVCHSGFKRLN